MVTNYLIAENSKKKKNSPLPINWVKSKAIHKKEVEVQSDVDGEDGDEE